MNRSLWLCCHLCAMFSASDERTLSVVLKRCEVTRVDPVILLMMSRRRGVGSSPTMIDVHIATLGGLESSRVGWCATGVHAQQASGYRRLVQYGGRIRRITRVDYRHGVTWFSLTPQT
jgi:hypothetical protein